MGRIIIPSIVMLYFSFPEFLHRSAMPTIRAAMRISRVYPLSQSGKSNFALLFSGGPSPPTTPACCSVGDFHARNQMIWLFSLLASILFFWSAAEIYHLPILRVFVFVLFCLGAFNILFVFVFETVSHFVALTGLELTR